ncbi:uncharacterized protein METZ01_LOCUS457837, partial [marine metagenome]
LNNTKILSGFSLKIKLFSPFNSAGDIGT